MAQGYMADFVAGLNNGLKKRIDEINDPVISAKIFKEAEKIIKEESEKNNKSASKSMFDILKDPIKLVKKYSNYLLSSNKRDSTIYDYCSEAKKFINFIVEEGIDFIDLNAVREYLAYQKKDRKLDNNGFRKMVFSLRSFLGYLIEVGLIYFDLRKIESPRKIENKQDVVTEMDFEKIRTYLAEGKERFKNCNLRDTVIIYLLECCGLRKQELINLNWENIDFNNGTLKIWNSKGGKDRKIPIGLELGKLLLEYRKVFKYYKGSVVRGIQSRKRINKNSLQDVLRRIYKEARVYREGLKIHSFRHAFTMKVSRESDIHIAQQRLGHSRLDTTEKYLHLYEDDMKRGVIDFPLPGKDGNHKN